MTDSILLGDLRQFVQDHAYDGSDVKANRLINLWISEALCRIYMAHDWSWYKHYDRLVTDAAVSGTDLVVTQNSRTVTTTAAVFLQKYVDHGWWLLTGTSPYRFRLAEVVSPTEAVLDEDHIWTEASASSVSFTIVKGAYEIPGGRITYVEDAKNKRPLHEQPNWYFDRLRTATQNQVQDDPIYYTIRRNHLELWPYPSTGRTPIGFSYTRPAPRYKVADDDTTVVDWPGDYLTLLHAAISMEVSEHLGEDAVVPVPLAIRKYETLLRQFKADDAKISDTEDKTLSLSGRRRKFPLSSKHLAQTKFAADA